MSSISRRSLLNAFPFAALGAPATKVARLETFVLKVNRRGNWILVRLTTDNGLAGIGEASQSGIEDGAQLELVREFFGKLAGRSIWDVEVFRQALFPEIARRGRAAVVAFGALEQCLWDLRGKSTGLPVCELLGGRLRASIRCYANINRSTDPRTPEGFAAMAEKTVAAGFDAVKLAPFDEMPRRLADKQKIREFMERGIACAEAVRKVIGPQRDLLIDAHNHFGVEDGIELARRFEPLKLFWLEEVTPAQPPENLAAIRKAAKMPTAGGENIFGVSGFYPYVKSGAVDIVMPDVKYCGGVWEMKRIAALAEGAGLKVSPHGPGSPVGHMIAAHVCATLPSFHILEYSFGEVPWRAEILDPPETIRNGLIEVPVKPGYGVALNDIAMARYLIK